MKGKLAVGLLLTAGVIPISLSQYLGMGLGWLVYYFNIREVKISRRNLQLCYPDMPLYEREKLLKASILSFGMQSFEIAYLWFGKRNRGMSLITEVSGQEVFQSAINDQKGIVVILPHLGNWEVVNAYVLSHIPGVAMYSPARLPEVDTLMHQGREKTSLELAEANKRGVIYLMKRLMQGGNLFILPDQEPERSGGEFAAFFGHEALTMTLISKMLQKTQATPILAYAERLGPNKGFNIVFKPVNDAILENDMTNSLSALNASVEESIREIPSQYMWGYKRFRKRPEGQKSLYTDLV